MTSQGAVARVVAWQAPQDDIGTLETSGRSSAVAQNAHPVGMTSASSTTADRTSALRQSRKNLDVPLVTPCIDLAFFQRRAHGAARFMNV